MKVERKDFENETKQFYSLTADFDTIDSEKSCRCNALGLSNRGN